MAKLQATLGRATTSLAAFLVLVALGGGCNDGGSSSGNKASDPASTPSTDPDSNPPPTDNDPPANDDPPEATAEVTATTPERFEDAADPDGEIVVVFSEAMDPDSFSSLTVRVMSALTGRVRLTLEELRDSGRTLSIRPERPFKAGEVVRVELLRGIETAAGEPFSGDSFEFSVRTRALTAPQAHQEVFLAIGRVDRLLTGDLNLDGHADLGHSVENGTVVDLLLGRGDGTFAPGLRIDAFQNVRALELADADADGDLDVLVGTSDRIRIYWNRTIEDWTGTPPDALGFSVGPEAPTGSAVREIAVVNADLQGRPDLVLALERGIDLRLGGLESPALTLDTAGSTARTNLVVADLNGDGLPDLIYGNRQGEAVTWHQGQGDATAPFGPPRDLAIGTEPEQIAVADLSGNSLPEVVVLTLDGATQPSAFRLLTLDGDAFRVASSFGPRNPPAADNGGGNETVLDNGRFVVADLDGDGALDVTLAAALHGRLVSFMNNSSNTPFSDNEEEIVQLPEPFQTVAIDLDGDGTLDLLAASGNEIHAFVRSGDEPPPPPPPGSALGLSIDPIQTRAGDEAVSALVRLTNPEDISGFTVVVGYDPIAVTPSEVNIDGTVTATAAPEFADFILEPERGRVRYAVLVDLLPPIEDRRIPSGNNQPLFRILFDVPSEAPVGEYPLVFVDDPETPGSTNVITVGAVSEMPQTLDGTLTVLAPVTPPDGNENRMQIGSTDLAPGEEGGVQVRGTNVDPAAAFTTVVTYDSDNLEINEIDLAGSVTESLGPELVLPSIRPESGSLILTVVFDFLPPFASQTISPGADQLLFTVRLGVRDTTPPGTYPLTLVNEIGEPPLSNIFVFDGASFFPELVSGEVRVTDGSLPTDPTGTFARGDANSDGEVNLPDSVFLSNFLFLSGPSPTCLDAADVNDDGELNLTDSIFLVNYLSGLGPVPPAPFPATGADPTSDDLTCGADV